jgi:hypothetical protein
MGVIGFALALFGVIAIETALRAIEDIRGHRRRMELWALVAGEHVLLWSTTDSLKFGRVCRALNRAWGTRRPRMTY